MAIDYGKKRTGIAVSDPLQIIATGLDTIATPKLMEFLDEYLNKEEVSHIVFGDSANYDGTPSHVSDLVRSCIKKLEKKYTDIEYVLFDEHLTSIRAKQAILQSGAKKKKRRDKSLVDKVSAIIILQDYLEQTKYNKL